MNKSTELKDWYNSPELAGLPGLPSSEFRLREKAKREAWKTRLRDAKGGGHEYHIESLPVPTRAHLMQAAAPKLNLESMHEILNRDRDAKRASRIAHMGKYAALSGDNDKRLRAEARYSVLRMFNEFRDSSGLKQREVFKAFEVAIQEKKVLIDAELLQWMPKKKPPTGATVKRWYYAWDKDGMWGLVDGYGNRKGQFKVDAVENLGSIIKGLMLKFPGIKPLRVMDYLEANHGDKEIPSLKSIERYMDHYIKTNHQAYTYMTNPDEWKNKYKVAFGSHHERVEFINHVWELDSTPGDWLLKDGRHSVVGVVDLFTRRLKLHVSKSSTAMAVCQTFRRAVVDWGVPTICRTDNGKDYVSNQFTGVLSNLGIEQELCVPFASEQKGTIERSLQTMSHGILELLPGFIGHSVADRKVIEARKSFAARIMDKDSVVEVELTSDELQEKLDQWCVIYHNDTHNGIEGKTPNQVVAESVTAIKVIDDERALDQLLSPIAGVRYVAKKGIRFDNHDFANPALAGYVGEPVTLRFDEQDIGRLFVYHEENFICVAECPEILGYSRLELSSAASAAQREFNKSQATESRAHKKAIKENPVDTIIAHKLSQAENVTPLQRTQRYSTTALEEAGIAARADEMPQQTDEQKTESQRLRDEFLKEWNETQPMQETSKPRLAVMPLAPVEESDNPKRRHARWLRLDKRVEAGERLTADEQKFHKRYPLSSDYQSMKQFFEDFGLDESSAG